MRKPNPGGRRRLEDSARSAAGAPSARPGRWSRAVLSVALAVVGAVLLGAGVEFRSPAPPAPAVPISPTGPAAAPAPTPGRATAVPGSAASGSAASGRSVPVWIDVPALGIHSPLVELGLRPDGTVAVPRLAAAAPAGWYKYLAAPGESGPAVILGHVDSPDGPAVFFRLGAARPGEDVFVRRADRRTLGFTVVAVRRYSKRAFPTWAVYGPVDRPVLRLVTCGGRYDRFDGTYLDTVVVYATMTT